jgi:DNA-binding CsgD family transcriptional regulator
MKLSAREMEVMELTAWGASAKEAADRLCVSTYTVQNHLKRIKEKLHLQKATEIAAAFFCMKFHISMDLSPLKRQVVASMLLLLLVFQMCFDSNVDMRGRRVRTTRGSQIERRIEFEIE